MDNFITFATRGEVKMLDLDFSDPLWSQESVEVHEALLQLPWFEKHGRLEFLKLYNSNPPVVSMFNPFSALKHISLGWIERDTESIRDLLFKCPVLEVLSFKECWYVEGNLQIDAPNLRNLIIDKCSIPPSTGKIIVNAPQLRYFKYSGSADIGFGLRSPEFGLSETDIIEEAELDFGLEQDYIEDDEIGDKLADMLNAISPVRTLTVCSFMLRAICDGAESIHVERVCGGVYSIRSDPTLDVRHLILKTALNRKEFNGITLLLNSCPTLQQLIIDLVPERIKDAEAAFDMEYHVFVNSSLSRKVSYECVRGTLSTIVVNGYREDPDEILALGYFLGYGRALRTMLIRIPRGAGAENEANYMEKVRRLRQVGRPLDLPKVRLRLQFFWDIELLA